jgi:hypothetical protein
MIIYLAAHAALVLFNLINSRIDAYRIMQNKTIAHAVNFGAYAVFAGLICWYAYNNYQWNIWHFVLFCVSAFANRQWSFDVPLNLRRHLSWDHVSTAKPPKAWLDRQEIRIFGYNGRAPVFMYAAIWLVCLIIKIWV